MLDGMRISTLMSEGLTRVKALAEAYQLVGRLNSQCPPAFVGDAHKVSMLARTVQDEPWAANVLEDNMVQPMSYHDFHSRLSAALTLRDETLTRASNSHSLLYGSQYATPRHKRVVTTTSPMFSDNLVSLLFTSQSEGAGGATN
jgi:hypothetical protein